MIIKVYMLAFGTPGEIREVEVPDTDSTDILLDSVFYYGQNDFQPQPHPSVSVGDVIEHEGCWYVVASAGFTQISEEQFAEYQKLPFHERHFHEFCI